jgi:glutaredoxin-like protein NrdH
MITVTVYTTGEGCMQCRLTRDRLAAAAIPATVVDLTDDANAAHRAFVTEDLGYSQAPIVIVDDEPENHWSGFRPDLIDRLAARVVARA